MARLASMDSSSISAQRVADLTQQLHLFFQMLDERRYDDLLEQFAPDGRWLRQGQWLTGRGEIATALAERPATMRVRHVITNIVVSPRAAGEFAVHAYMTAYRQRAEGRPELFRLNLVSCVYRRGGDNWLLAEQQLLPEFDFSQSPR